MKIEQVTLQNFRSFGPQPETIRLGGRTSLIGANGSGKSSTMMALVRMFGATSPERTLEPGDVHVPHGKRLEDLGPTTISIEAQIALPEIETGSKSIGAVFNQMVVPAPGASPYCRMRLEGRWSGGAADEGEMDVSLSWIATTDPVPKPEHVYRVTAVDRARIQVHYVPAARDPARQLRAVSTALLARLFRGVEFSSKVADLLRSTSEDVRMAFQDELGIKAVTTEVERAWRTLNDAPHFSRIGFRPFEAELDDLLRRVEMVLGPAPHTSEVGVERLSDGQKSLFYLSLIASVFSVEDHVNAGKASSLGLSAERLTPPMLTFLAVEEPENHLAPHYLARIMNTLDTIGGSSRGQVLLTSHSPAILGRVEPEAVRYLRLDSTTGRSSIKEITLPAKSDDAHLYVRQAVLAFPELYFAKLVVLGEGDGEMVLLPRLAMARGTHLDRNFVSVVPLGGRHVNHFWRLLSDLGIPHVTLLDLDRERFGGGWGRVHYALSQLIERGTSRDKLLECEYGVLTEQEFADMTSWPFDELASWIDHLEAYDVFFSEPLDIDFMMLRAFPAAYRATVPPNGGPKLPSNPEDLEARIERATRTVLKDNGGDGSSFSQDEKNDFPWYSNLFLNRGKPTTHLLAMAALTDDQLRSSMPPVLERLLDWVEQKLK
ncbi:ATP-dependent nuclease [Sorangium sp. So ce693]|uniref:ATP-dependent nuclease n=1 Tax=Sorangium sp. So ce693 TaxID=3133318 RepID=UPI003F60F7EB